MGINTNRVFALTFGLGAACGSRRRTVVQLLSDLPRGGVEFCDHVFCYRGLWADSNIGGAFLAGIFVGLVENVGGFLIGPEFKYTLVFVLYLIVISLRPKGLFGW
jgi:branched-chain amino acid transport system permease protein